MVLAVLALGACAMAEDAPLAVQQLEGEPPTYVIGPLDTVTVFVWREPELSASSAVRPDGRATFPLVEELFVAGKTPQEVAADVEAELGNFLLDPIVSVSVGGFNGPFDQQVRILGQATTPQAIPYRADMTVLDVLIQSGGLTEFAAGNRTSLVRLEGDELKTYRLRLDDLLGGDISANAEMLPGDVIIIPESFF